MNAAVFNRFNGWFGQLLHTDVPLIGQPGLDHSAGAIATGDFQSVGFNFFQQAQGFERLDNFLAGVETIQTCVGLRCRFASGRLLAGKREHIKGGRDFGVTASIGLTELSPNDSGPREVMARADEGSYIAKSRGRNAVVVVPVTEGEQSPSA